jgi:LacI family transcriptional regulator
MKDGMFHVALLTYLATAWGRRVLQGIVEYARQHGPWLIWTATGAKDEPLRIPSGWRCDGIIARLSTRTLARQVFAAGVPVVNISRIMLSGVDAPRVTDDVCTSAKLAIEHFCDRGFRHFAYCGELHSAFLTNHCQAFVEAMQVLGHTCHVYRPSHGAGSRANWLTRQKDLIRWLKRLPKPVAVLTWTVPEGRELIDACRAGGFLVPEEVAVLAGDDDELMCEICHPPLSGVAIAAEQIGREAASLLDRLMRGQRIPYEPVIVPPLRVVTRQSTDTLAITDPDLTAAIRFIRDHASEPIRVADVLRAVPISRSQLERHFLRVLGRTPADEIRRVHVQRAVQLLADTNLPIPRVASASGFNSPEYLAHTFKAATGLSPLKYRNRAQRG